MAEDTTTAPELTAEQVQRILLQPLEATSIFLAAGPRIFDTDGNSVRIPRLTGSDAPSWHGEGEQIDEVDADWGELTLLPSTMKSVKSLTKFSNELARQSVVALDSALQARMVRDVATKLDNAFISGNGGTPAGSEPVGILNFTGVTEQTAVGDITLDALHDAVGSIMAANADLAGTRWMMRPEVFTTLRKLKDSNERYQLQPDPTEAGMFRLLGIPVTVTTRIPTTGTAPKKTQVVLADVGTVAVARDIAPSVKVLDQTFGDYDQMAIRVTARYDLAPMYPEAIVILRGVNA